MTDRQAKAVTMDFLPKRYKIKVVDMVEMPFTFQVHIRDAMANPTVQELMAAQPMDGSITYSLELQYGGTE